MERKQRKDFGRGRKKCTKSLTDLLCSVGVKDTQDWLDYVDKIIENKAVVPKSTNESKNVEINNPGNNENKNSGKPILLPPLPLMDKQSRKMKKMKLEIKKLFEPELQREELPEKENKICQALVSQSL
ncbi:uncharacterized protein LOC108033496 isoform X2 [Drosophila biarmipes]|uniref:uncharacterized protein LOC108033496 isoform X2 n=1 Tax=Drosophila biarmipes TaxID=125945 RepID=UPI0007E7D647|nr:uncharacterized protein LOC108033496 isoform X2 [Drosophila biarmipes]